MLKTMPEIKFYNAPFMNVHETRKLYWCADESGRGPCLKGEDKAAASNGHIKNSKQSRSRLGWSRRHTHTVRGPSFLALLFGCGHDFIVSGYSTVLQHCLFLQALFASSLDREGGDRQSSLLVICSRILQISRDLLYQSRQTSVICSSVQIIWWFGTI